MNVLFLWCKITSGFSSRLSGVLLLILTLWPAAGWTQVPPNDDFENRIAITGQTNTVTGSNVGATKSPFEPMTSAGNHGGKSVWWTWTAPVTETATLDTVGSSFDTLLAVYTGPIVQALAARGSDDDGAANGRSKLVFTAIAGTEYQIVVDGYNRNTLPENAASGDITLNLRQGPLPPEITGQPKDQAVFPGSQVTLTAVTSGALPLSYLWLKDGTSISDSATNSSYTIANAQPQDSGVYSLVVSNNVGMAVSSNALLTVGTAIITNQPIPTTVAVGYDASFTVGATGVEALAYQWRKDGTPIPDATNPSLTLPSVQLGGAGVYSVVVSNSQGSLTSSGAVLTVISPYTFTTIAGIAGSSGTNDGPVDMARFDNPTGLAEDDAGNLYVTEYYQHTVRKITPDGIVTTFAGLAGVSGSADGVGSAARFHSPEGIVADDENNLLVADNFNHTIRKITPDGVVSTLAGKAGTAGWVDGPPDVARFGQPSGLALDQEANLYVADWRNNAVRKIAPDGTVSTLAGPLGNSVDGFGLKAALKQPAGVAVSPEGNLFVAEGIGRIRMITPDGMASRVANVGLGAYGGTFDEAGNYLFVGAGDYAVRRIAATGEITLLAGSLGTPGHHDGSGINARFRTSRNGMVVDTAGNLYLTDSGNAVIRKGVPFDVSIQPQDPAVQAGQSVTLEVDAASGGPFSYQWKRDGVILMGETNASLALNLLGRDDSGVYSVTISNNIGNRITLRSTVRALVRPVIQSPQLLADGTVRLSFQDEDGGLPYDLGKVEVQWRTNLPTGIDTNWQSLSSNFIVTNGVLIIEDTNRAEWPSRFYRVVEH